MQIKAIGQIFTGLYSLDDSEVGNASYEMALKEPEKFVLKPQREGGGNNVYGVDIPDALRVSVKLFFFSSISISILTLFSALIYSMWHN